MDSQVEIETRLARVEASVDAIIRDMGTLSGNVKELASCVRQQGSQTEEQLKSLLVQVTSAAGPKKTDWHLVVTSIGVTLAIGAAVFAPLNLRVNDLQENAKQTLQRLEAHIELPMHPVAISRVSALETSLNEKQHRLEADIVAVDSKLQEEYRLISDKLENAIQSADIRLQGALEAADTRLQREIGVVEKKIDGSLLYQNESRERNARQDEQIRSLTERKP